MRQTKIKSVETYKDSQGKHIVCKGKLVLIDKTNDNPLGNSNGPCFQAIIISETEEIEVGDKVFTIDSNEIWEYTEDEKEQNVLCELDRKILALPENFSPKHLQAIADGKLKDGDEVFVECDNYEHYEVGYEKAKIKLNKDNHIKLFPVKKEEKLYPKAFIDALHGMSDSTYTDRMYEKWKKGKL